MAEVKPRGPPRGVVRAGGEGREPGFPWGSRNPANFLVDNKKYMLYHGREAGAQWSASHGDGSPLPVRIYAGARPCSQRLGLITIESGTTWQPFPEGRACLFLSLAVPRRPRCQPVSSLPPSSDARRRAFAWLMPVGTYFSICKLPEQDVREPGVYREVSRSLIFGPSRCVAGGGRRSFRR